MSTNQYPSTSSGQPNAETNSSGPYTAESDLSYPPTLGTGTPPPTPDYIYPQAPSGVITGPVVTPAPASPGQAPPATRTSPAFDNYQLSQSSTDISLEDTSPNIATQQGTAALTAATQQTIAGCPSVQINNYYGGSVGSVGTKFS